MASVWWNGRLRTNRYDMVVGFQTKTADDALTNIAMERMKCVLHVSMQDTVFVGPADIKTATQFNRLGISVTTLPHEPVDQIIGMALYCKLNAVMEGRMVITDLDFSSHLGDDVWYAHDAEEEIGPFAQKGWWHTPDLKHNDIHVKQSSDKIVSVSPSDWTEFDLTWPDPDASGSDAVILYPDFKKHES